MSVGYASTSKLSSSANTQNKKKINIYNEMAQYLVGYDHTGSIKKFKIPSSGAEMKECIFVPFSRLLSKDEIKKGSFTYEYGCIQAFGEPTVMAAKRVQLKDLSGSSGYYVDSPSGEYGELYATSSGDNTALRVLGESTTTPDSLPPVGLIYYQAGIAVISGSIFGDAANNGALTDTIATSQLGHGYGATGFDVITGSTIAKVCDGIRNRCYNISYNNTTELNSTIYFCRVNHSDFNYSSNPTYMTASKLRVKTRAADSPVSYITTIGLYSADNELLAVAKLSEPLRKDPTNELTLRVRLDY